MKKIIFLFSLMIFTLVLSDLQAQAYEDAGDRHERMKEDRDKNNSHETRGKETTRERNEVQRDKDSGRDEIYGARNEEHDRPDKPENSDCEEGAVIGGVAGAAGGAVVGGVTGGLGGAVLGAATGGLGGAVAGCISKELENAIERRKKIEIKGESKNCTGSVHHSVKFLGKESF